MRTHPLSKIFTQKFTASVLIGSAVLGWLISLSGLVLLWLSYQPVKSTATEVLEVTEGALEVSSQTIVLLENSLLSAEASLGEVQTTLNGFSSVIGNTSTVLEVISQVLQDELIQILRDTSTGLEGLEKTSRLIDNTLNFISSVPFIGSSQYQPETPLAESVASIRKDLQGLPPAMDKVSSELSQTASSLQSLPEAMDNLTLQLTAIQENLKKSRNQMDEYHLIIQSYQNKLERFKNNLPVFISGSYVIISVLFVWIALAQIGLFNQGMEHLTRSRNIANPQADLQESADQK
jgi:methyl-accepting chemotaxis protein